jgi:hypothetical protein
MAAELDAGRGAERRGGAEVRFWLRFSGRARVPSLLAQLHFHLESVRRRRQVILGQAVSTVAHGLPNV